MFDGVDDGKRPSDSPQLLAGLVQHLTTLTQHEVSDAERIDRIRRLEEAEAVLAAARARETAAFAASQRAVQRARGVAAERIGRGVSAQVGLARRISPWAAARYVGQAEDLIEALPLTFARLAAGELSEWRALLIARQSSWLSPAHRGVLDAELAPRVARLGTRRIVDLVNTISYRLDPHGYLSHLDRTTQERAVSLRPASPTMARLSALLPLTQGVAVYAALHTAAGQRAGVGAEARSRSQLMADLLVERVTGQRSAPAVPVAVNLIMTDQTLFQTGQQPEEPAVLIGGGVIPAALARRTLADTTGEAEVFLRRLYTVPGSGQLAAMDSQARCFTPTQRHFLLLRDQVCRTPYCDAPIRHGDHITPAQHGGATSIDNGQGLCQA